MVWYLSESFCEFGRWHHASVGSSSGDAGGPYFKPNLSRGILILFSIILNTGSGESRAWSGQYEPFPYHVRSLPNKPDGLGVFRRGCEEVNSRWQLWGYRRQRRHLLLSVQASYLNIDEALGTSIVNRRTRSFVMYLVSSASISGASMIGWKSEITFRHYGEICRGRSFPWVWNIISSSTTLIYLGVSFHSIINRALLNYFLHITSVIFNTRRVSNCCSFYIHAHYFTKAYFRKK